MCNELDALHRRYLTPPAGPEAITPVTLDVVVRQLLASPEPIAIGHGPTLRALHNEAFAAAIGAEPAGDEAAVTLRDLCGALWPRLAPTIDRALSGEATVLEDQLLCRSRNGYPEEVYLRFACSPLMDECGVVTGVVITLRDKTDRVVSDRRTAALRAIATAAAPKCSIQEACQRALAAVAQHPSDVPFALLYLSVAGRERSQALRLAAAAGVQPGTPASPELIDARWPSNTRGWPIAAALDTNQPVVVEDLLNRFGTLPAGDWPFAPRQAVVAPVRSPGRLTPEGVLICGVSARHALNSGYRAFIDLVANQIAAAIAGGRVHEGEVSAAQARAAARRAQAKRRARVRAMKAKFAGALEERTRLAREIHDTLLQGVTGIALQLRAVLPDVRAAPDAAAEALQSIVELADRTSREAREAVWDMRPGKCSGECLAQTLEVAARRLTAGSSVALRMSLTGRKRSVDAQQRGAIVRIVQEAIANAVRHAKPRAISLQLAFERRRLRIDVVDDGCGFTVERDFHSYEGHWGLLGMSERARSLGGSLEVRSAPGYGTTVTLLLPLIA